MTDDVPEELVLMLRIHGSLWTLIEQVTLHVPRVVRQDPWFADVRRLAASLGDLLAEVDSVSAADLQDACDETEATLWGGGGALASWLRRREPSKPPGRAWKAMVRTLEVACEWTRPTQEVDEE